MIGLSSPTFDPLGSVTLQELPSSELDSVSRRVNRVKTLDGGVVVNDGGYAVGDRTFRIAWRLQSADQFESVRRLVRLYPRVNIATREGVFLASIQDLSRSAREASLTLLVIQKLSQE